MNSKLNWGRILLTGASFAALGAVSSYAQDETADETIIVTATGRAAAIQDVPLAITAVTGESLENAGVTDLRELQQLTPSYRFFTGQSNSAGTTAYIRGLGTGGDNPGFESAVGFFIDGVYRNRSGVALSELPEVERIEVLRGPQGTLFGRNTSAGAISVVTAGPDFDTSAWMQASVGNYGYTNAQVGMTGPLFGDAVAARIDLSGTARDGFIHDVNTDKDVNNRDRSSGRFQLLWDINPDASFRFILDGAQTDEVCCAAVTALATGPIPGAVNAIAGAHGLTGVVVPPDPEARVFASTPGRDYREAVDEWGVSGQLDWNLGGVNLTSITAYRDWSAKRNQDIDFSGIDRAYRDGYLSAFKTTSQELRLQGEAGRLNWLVGGYYSDEKLHLRDTIRFGADAATYVDALASGFAGSQIYGTIGAHNGPGGTAGIMDIFDVFAGEPPDALAAVALTGTARVLTGNPALTSAQAFALASPLAPNAVQSAQLRATYNGAANILAATAPVSGGGQNDNYNVDTTTMALFTHNEISLSDSLKLTIGARYNHEKKDFGADIAQIDLSPAPSTCQVFNAAVASTLSPPVSASNQAILGLIGQLGALRPLVCSPAINEQALGLYSDNDESNEWNGVVSLSYNVSEDLMLYGSVSRGYKAGGYNLDRLGFNFELTGLTGSPDPTVAPSAQDLKFKPEFVDAYELGWKWEGFDGGLTLNGAIYRENISDYQLLAFTGFNFITRNVEKAISQGMELDFQLRPTSQLQIQGGVAYNDAFYDSPVSSGGASPETLPAGTEFSQAPKYTVTSAVTYEQPLGDDLVALFYLDGRWNSEYIVQTFGRNPITDNKAYAIFNARVGLGAQDQRWSVEAWVRNLSDQYYNIGGFAVTEQTALGTGNWAVYPGEPRTYGITLKARY